MVKNGVSLKKGAKVFLDSMIFIYKFESEIKYGAILEKLFAKIESGYFTGLTSTLTIAECLTKPKKEGSLALIAKYIALFRNFPNLEIYPLTFAIAERTAGIRAEWNLKTPDAIQLATATEAKANIFLTHDLALSKYKHSYELSNLDHFKI